MRPSRRHHDGRLQLYKIPARLLRTDGGRPRIGRSIGPSGYAGRVEVQADPGQRVSWVRRLRHPTFVLRMAALTLVGVLAVNASVALISNQHWRRESADITTQFHPTRIKAVEKELRRNGVRISRDVHQLLAVLLTEWESRADLQASFSTPAGDPDIGRLLDWASGLPDAFSTAIVPRLGAIAELKGRMSILPPDGNVLPVLYWTLQNRIRPFSNLGPVIARLADVWKRRPELGERFTMDGRVDVPALLQWANTLPPSDPSFTDFVWQYFEIRQAIVQLSANRNA